MFKRVEHVISAMIAAGLLAGCGLVGTGGAAAVDGAASAQQASDAKKQLDKVKSDVEAAQKTADDSRAAAEAAAQ